MANCCPCLRPCCQSADPEIEIFAQQPLGKALREDWLQKVSDRDPRSRQVFVRLTADAVAFYSKRPAGPPAPAGTLPAPRPSQDILLPADLGVDDISPGASAVRYTARPLEVVLLSHITSLRGRGKGSDHLRIEDSHGQWWELRSDTPSEVEAWVKAISGRLNHFREAARRSKAFNSALVSMPDLDDALRRRRGSKTLERLGVLAASVCDFRRTRKGRMNNGISRRLTSRSPRPYRGSREGHSDLVQGDRLAEVTDPDLQEVQGANWSDQAVRFLRACDEIPEELSNDFSLTLRQGVPDGLKRLIWPLAAGGAIYPPDEESRNRAAASKVGQRFRLALSSTMSHPDPGAFYESLCSRAFGSVMPQDFQDPVPTFCQGIKGLSDAPPLAEVVKHVWLLTPHGQTALRRLLWCTQLTTHTIDFCPFLPNLFATLLAFFDEAEAMMIVHCIIKDFEDDPFQDKSSNPRIILSRSLINKQAKLFVREGKKSRNCPEALGHLETLGVDTHAMAVELLQDGLAHRLPFRAFCRVVGSFLREGSEVVLRYGLALVQLATPRIVACSTAEEARRELEGFCADMDGSPESVDRLTKTAFSIVLRDTSMLRVSSLWGSDYVAPKPDYSRHIFCRPRLCEPRGSCPDDLWEAIWSWVPNSCRILDPAMIYSPSTHGTSLRTVLEICKKHMGSPMVFFLYTKEGDVLGGFSPTVWVRSTAGYLQLTTLRRSVEDAMVFRRLKRSQAELDAVCQDQSPSANQSSIAGVLTQVFPWTSSNEMLMKASESSGLIFGGDGAAIYINKELTRAETGECASFSSPPLLPVPDRSAPSTQVVEFEIARFEVFALE